MKISLEWLREYIELPESPEKLKEDLTMFGLIVEAIEDRNGSSVLELEVTSNRPDCLSHLGVAREIGALYSRPVRYPAIQRSLKARTERIPYKIEIRDPDLCPRYTGLVLDGITVAASPDWMQKRLEDAGMRPLNNIVDITNYVLLELGHPLHAFDFEQLNQGTIVVARAADGQKMVTLDGAERTLDCEMLLINDGAGPVAIAGVMGGLHSEISLTTRTILLECAYFQSASVRRTSKRLGLSTEASYRFERGVDWDDALVVIARTCHLIRDLAGGRIAGSVQDVYPHKIEPVQIELQRKRAEGLLGVDLADDFVESSLKRLNFQPSQRGKGNWRVTCPSYRADMELEADLIEEIARFYGYQNIPTTFPAGKDAGIASPVEPAESAVRRILLGLGYSEAVNLSFTDASDQQEFPSADGAPAAVRNPLTEDTGFLRSSLAPGLVRSAKYNFNYDQHDIRLFEIGKVYRRNSDGAVVERNMLGILGAGSFAARNWLHPGDGDDYSYFHLKGTLTALLDALRCASAEILPDPETRWLNPVSASALVAGGVRLGTLGSLHPSLEEKYKLRRPVYLCEIDFEALSQHILAPVHYEPLPRFPAVERDLSIVVDQGSTYGSVRTGITGLGIRELRAVDLIDVYEGATIPAGKVSLTLRFVFLDPERTLTVDRVQGFSDNILTFLRNTFGAERR